MTKDATGDKADKKKGGWVETIKTVVYAGLIALGIRTVAYEPFNIPSESMYPTLLVGDYLFVSKWSVGYSRHSMLFSPPLFKGRIFEKPPERGDILVFKTPADNSTDYIKRLVGMPGDRIQMRGGVLHINDQPIKRERVADFPYQDRLSRPPFMVAQFRETMPNGKSFLTLDGIPNGDYDNTRVFTVPAGHYFMMGDNRDNSLDSRVETASGGTSFVPAENLVGRADFLWFSHQGFVPRFSRIFTLLGP